MISEYKLTDTEAIVDCLLELQNTENTLEPSRVKDRNIAELYFKEIQNKISNNSGQIFVSTNENEITGILIVYIEENEIIETPGKHLLISDISVKSNYRNSGIGKELIKKAELFAFENEIDDIRVYTLVHNKVALSLYRNSGYKDFGIALKKQIRLQKNLNPCLSNIRIRTLNENEEIPYHLLLLADPSKDMIDSYLNSSTLFIATIDDKLVGTFVLFSHSDNLIEIKNIAVDTELQGKGIGYTLLRNAIRIAKTKNYSSICIGTGNSSIGELYLYQKAGFEISEIKNNFFIQNYPEPIFDNGIQVKHMIMLSMNL